MYKQIYDFIYKKIRTDQIQRISDGALIPFDPDNTAYQAYLKWLNGYELVGLEWVKTSEGNTPLPADEGEQV